MAQGGAHIPSAPGSPAKQSTTKTEVPARAPSSGTVGVARPRGPLATTAKPSGAVAPKAQPRPALAAEAVAVAPTKPVATAPAKLVATAPANHVALAPAAPPQKPASTGVVNSDAMEKRVGPRPVAAVKPLQPASIESPQDLRPVVRALIDASVAPFERTLRDLQRRVEELERRPGPAPVLAPAPTLVATRAPLLDVAAIERTVVLGAEAESFDGKRRRRRLLVATAVAILVLFGSLFAALAESYTHTHP